MSEVTSDQFDTPFPHTSKDINKRALRQKVGIEKESKLNSPIPSKRSTTSKILELLEEPRWKWSPVHLERARCPFRHAQRREPVAEYGPDTGHCCGV